MSRATPFCQSSSVFAIVVAPLPYRANGLSVRSKKQFDSQTIGTGVVEPAGVAKWKIGRPAPAVLNTTLLLTSWYGTSVADDALAPMTQNELPTPVSTKNVLCTMRVLVERRVVM